MRVWPFLVFLLFLASGCCFSEKKQDKTQILRINLYCEPPSLDSRKSTDSTSGNVLLMLFEGLMRVDENHQPVPAIAESVDISEDGRTYTFKLRPSLWSNGDEVTADDFVYAWKKILDPHFPSLFAYKLYVIQNAAAIKEGKLPLDTLGVKAVDPRTLVVRLNYPTPYFLELTAFSTFYPVHRKNDEAHPDWAHNAGKDYICNGPFCLKSWKHESEILVEKNPLYWDAASVKLDKIHLSMIEDTTTEFYMYEMGELDWAGSPLSNLPPEFIPALKKEKDMKVLPAAGVYYYKINTEKYPLGNKDLRKALCFAINRRAIVDHITQGGQRPATCLVPPMPGWNEPQDFFRDADVETAKAFFASACEQLGIEKKNFPRLVLSFNTNREHHKIAQAIQHQWKEALGIDVELENTDWKVYLSKINRQDYQIGRLGWLGDFHDPVSFLEPFKFKDNPHIGGNNETGWENADYIECLDLAQKETDPEKRASLLRKAEKIIIEDLPVIPLYFINYCYLKKPYVKGVYISPLGVADFKSAFLEYD